ncbi:MAG: HAD-IIA family hydrolase [Candidatus Altiarchaeota archaeon]|nr:HAD-IIA family hydrolase [Candidatus Altiarchaeota archaeon]
MDNKPFKNIDCFIFDFDGVIWWGETMIDGVKETLDYLRAKGKRIIFLTNNSMKSRREYVEKLAKMGFKTEVGYILTSGYVTSLHIKKKYGLSKIYPIGSPGLVEELKFQGHTIVDRKPDFVVMGFSKDLCYNDLKEGYKKIVNGGARLIACNYDRLANHGEGVVPVLGAFVNAMEYSTGFKAEVIGKPNKPMIDALMDSINIPPNKCMIFGDNLETDIQFGKNAGMKTTLVLTGVHSRDDVERLRIKPDVILNSVVEIEL